MVHKRKDPHHHQEPPKESRRSHLRLVTKGSLLPVRKKEHTRVVGTFLAIFTLTLGLIFYLSTNNTIPLNKLYTTFLSLRPTLQRDGALKFQTEKGALRSIVEKALNDSTKESEQAIAENIAVYLFPELLPNENFEKSVAMEQWKPLQEAIERQPKDPASRIFFEEMRANIWNYESPDRESPRISDYAKEVLRLYDELSTP